MILSPASGSIQPNSVGGPALTFDLARLQTGLNSGLITIKSDSSAGDVAVKVTVTKTPPGVAVNRLEPLGFVFVPPFAAQTAVYVPSQTGSKLNLTSNQSWLTVEDLNAKGPVHQLKLSIVSRNLPVGQPQYGAVTIQESNGQPAILNVLGYAPVTAAGGNRSRSARRPATSSTGCVPSQFYSYPTSFGLNFEQNGGAATSTEIFNIDDCGNPVKSAVSGGVLGNRDPQLNLRSLGDGRWKATWNPTTPNSFVTMNILGADPDNSLYAPPVQAFSSITGTSGAPALAKDQPFETEVGVRLPALAPSMQFRIRGQNLLNPDGTAPVVSIGGRAIQVINATSSQLLVLTPTDLAVNLEMQLVVRRTDASSVPEPVIVAASWPAVAAVSGDAFLVTGLGKALPESLMVDGATIRSIEPAGVGLWRVVADGDLRGMRLRARP